MITAIDWPRHKGHRAHFPNESELRPISCMRFVIVREDVGTSGSFGPRKMRQGRGVAFIDHWNPHWWRQHLWRLQPQSSQAGDRAHPKAPRLPPRSANLIRLRRWMWVQKRRLQRKKMNPTFGAFWLLATRRLAAWRYRFAQKCDLNPIAGRNNLCSCIHNPKKFESPF
jgi:hypothetical protein